jgi:poly-gamma-glutamate capsule biosynthesis protein CapA/YwtB (metallophosphatase superfamily)
MKEPKKDVSLVAVGDVCLAGRVNEKLGTTDPFEYISNEITNADISLGNLECVLTGKVKFKPKRGVLGVEPIAIKYLKIFKILSLANNHTLDFGITGMKETVDLLEKNSISTLGSGEDYPHAIQPIIFEVNSQKIAFINFVYSFIQDEIPLFSKTQRIRRRKRPGPARYSQKEVFDWIRKLKEKTDYIIVSIHWDKERLDYPAPPQRFLAEKLIDNGVDIILGHHPHVIQGVQKYRNGLIFYSLGNFLFDSLLMKRLPETKYGMMVKLTLSSKGITKYRLIPITTSEDCNVCTLPRGSNEEASLLKHIQDISTPLTYSRSEYFKFWSERVAESYLNACYIATSGQFKPLFKGRMRPIFEKIYKSIIMSILRLEYLK